MSTLEHNSDDLRQTIARLEALSEERAVSLDAYARQVEQIVANGEASCKAFEGKIAQLCSEHAEAVEAMQGLLSSKEIELEGIRAELYKAEEGRLKALARIEKAEMMAESANAEAESGAAKAQAAEMRCAIASQKLEAALSTIDRVAAAHAAAQDSEREAHELAAKWKTEVDALQALRKKLHNELVDLKGNIRVFCRIRPSKRELRGEAAASGDFGGLVVNPHPTNASGEVIDVFDASPVGTDSGLRRYNDGRRHQFAFDKVFDGSKTQDDVYAEVAPLVQSAIDGFSLCIFAYGQTGSGKTHTMIGDTEVGDVASADGAGGGGGLDRGIVYRACEQLFADLSNECAGSKCYDSAVTIEAVEIYNEKLMDLLPLKEASKGVKPSTLEIRKEKEGHVFIEGIEAHPVRSVHDAVGFLDRALRQRATKATRCNDQSSRSHCVLIVRFKKTDRETGEVKSGALHFCDLAGSERLAKSGSNEDPALLREAQAINKSLSALGNTMSALVAGGRHVPFRDSKLTFLLQECFTGDGKSLLVCALSPEADNIAESVGSLRFAQTVSQVTAANRTRCLSCGDKMCSSGTKGAKAEEEAGPSAGDKRLRTDLPAKKVLGRS